MQLTNNQLFKKSCYR